MNEEIIELSLKKTKKGYPAVWVKASRNFSPETRYGEANVICLSSGELSKVFYTEQKYTAEKNLVNISKKCVYITAKYNIDGSVVNVYKLENIDYDSNKVVFTKVASFCDEKWDKPAYSRHYKVGLHSAVRKAKKFYFLKDIR